MFKQVIPDLDANQLRQFGLILGGLLIFVIGIYMPWLWSWKLFPNYYCIFSGSCIALWSILNPSSIRGLYQLWMRISLSIGEIVNFFILFLIFFLIITPMGLVRKLFGYDPMLKNFEPNTNSYRIKSRITARESIERPY
jgi:hypothetical protein